MNKQNPTTPKPENRPPSQFKKTQGLNLQVVVKVTEIDEVKEFLKAIDKCRDKVEDGDISKGTAYNRIIIEYDELRRKIGERCDESDD